MQNSSLNINAFPIDVLSQIVCEESPSTVELVCKRWMEASRNRRYLCEFAVPSEVLPRYPYLATLDGMVDGLTDYVLESKIDLTVRVSSFTLEQFIEAYNTGNHRRLEFVSHQDGLRVVSFDGSLLSIHIGGRFLPGVFRNWKLEVNQLKGLIDMFSTDFAEVDSANNRLRLTIGNCTKVDLAPLAKVKWGKFDLDISCGDASPIALPSMKVGRLRMLRPVASEASLAAMLCNMNRMMFDSAAFHNYHCDFVIESFAGIKLVKGFF